MSWFRRNVEVHEPKPVKWIIRKRQNDGTIKHLITLSQQPEYNSLANYGSGEYLIQECRGKKFSKAQKVTVQSPQPQKPEKVIAKTVKPKVQVAQPHRPKQNISKRVKPQVQVAQPPKSKKAITKIATPKVNHTQPQRPIPRPPLPVVAPRLKGNHKLYNPPIRPIPQPSRVIHSQSKTELEKDTGDEDMSSDEGCPYCGENMDKFRTDLAIICEECEAIFCTSDCFYQYHKYMQLYHTGTSMDSV